MNTQHAKSKHLRPIEIGPLFHYAPQPNCKFNVDANSGHAFGILLAAVGTLRPYGAPAPVN